ncbi:MAG TPA: hypothetical protein PK771_14740, partial [Spirochaetota bacterium]|nr:hypothetical protein [Spirochaetota bacterium]
MVESDNKYNFRIEKRKRYIFIINIVLLCFFSVNSVTKIFSKVDVIFGILLLITNSFFILNLFNIKKEKLKLASEIIHILSLINIILMMFTTTYLHFFELYRNLAFILCIFFISSFISYRTFQILFYSLTIVAFHTIAIYLRIYPHISIELMTTFKTTIVASYITIITILTLSV